FEECQSGEGVEVREEFTDSAFAGTGNGMTGTGSQVGEKFRFLARLDRGRRDLKSQHHQEVAIGLRLQRSIFEGPKTILHLSSAPLPLDLVVVGGIGGGAVGDQVRLVQGLQLPPGSGDAGHFRRFARAPAWRVPTGEAPSSGAGARRKGKAGMVEKTLVGLSDRRNRSGRGHYDNAQEDEADSPAGLHGRLWPECTLRRAVRQGQNNVDEARNYPSTVVDHVRREERLVDQAGESPAPVRVDPAG